MSLSRTRFCRRLLRRIEVGRGGSLLRDQTTEPDAKTHKMMGKFKSEAEAKAAMAAMKEYGG